MALRIVEDGDYYNESFEEFLKKTNQVERDQEILHRYLPNAVSKILQGHQRSQFNVLSIGCGNGGMDRYIVNVIKEELQRHEKYRNTKIFIRAIDPNGHSLTQYKAYIDSPHNDHHIAYNVSRKTFKEYKQEQMSKSGEEEKFDIVHFIHSIYYVNPEEALDYCFEKVLHENGRVLFIVEGCDDDLIRSSGAANPIPALQIRRSGPHKSYAEELQRIAEKRGWKVDFHMQEFPIDVTEIFDENSREGDLLLDFLTHVKSFRTGTERKKVEEVLKLIKESSQVMEDGRRLGKKIDGILSIYRHK